MNMNNSTENWADLEDDDNEEYPTNPSKLKSKRPPLNILNLNWPSNWKVILIMDQNITGVHGEKELKEFRELKKSKFTNSNSNFKSLVMNIIPGIIEQNFTEFSKGLREIQDNMSKIFYGN